MVRLELTASALQVRRSTIGATRAYSVTIITYLLAPISHDYNNFRRRLEDFWIRRFVLRVKALRLAAATTRVHALIAVTATVDADF